MTNPPIKIYARKKGEPQSAAIIVCEGYDGVRMNELHNNLMKVAPDVTFTYEDTNED